MEGVVGSGSRQNIGGGVRRGVGAAAATAAMKEERE